jgi:hypothetical protein
MEKTVKFKRPDVVKISRKPYFLKPQLVVTHDGVVKRHTITKEMALNLSNAGVKDEHN